MIGEDSGSKVGSSISTAARTRPTSVLIVEDNPATARALTELLESHHKGHGGEQDQAPSSERRDTFSPGANV